MNNQTAPFRPMGLPTLIGSLPLRDHGEALARIFQATPEIPLWPQLPGNPGEGMLNQFIAGLPGVVETEEKTFFDTTLPQFEADHLAFFEKYLAVTGDMTTLLQSFFGLTRERAAGIYTLAAAIGAGYQARAVKGQITGPFTLLTGLHDRENRFGYYDPTIREIMVKGLALRAAWQVTYLKQNTGLPVICFIDEPALAGLGSTAFISIAPEDIAQDIREVATAITQAGGLAGIHVCANTDWNFIFALDLDIISFDAHGFFDRFITCRDQLLTFLCRGGIMAWGGIPTAREEEIRSETAESLAALWERHAEAIAAPGLNVADVLRQTLITPSCGTGSLSLELADRVLCLTRDVAAILRQRHGLASE